jgi:hypothetical protein
MVLSPATVVASSLHTIRWIPALGILLAGLGSLLLGAGMVELALPMLPTGTAYSPRASGETMTAQVAPLAPSQSAGGRNWGSGWSGAAEVGPARQGQSGGSVACLGHDLVAGRRTESAHLAIVALPESGACGDVRDALKVIAAVRYVGSEMSAWRCVITELACHSPAQTNSDDRIATALFAPTHLQSSASSGADMQESDPQVPPEGWDVRWDLFEIAGAQRGDWNRQCPCPVYPSDNPLHGPR